MSFDLSFSPEFFFNEGEPYDANTEESKRPTSVWQAIISMSPDDWLAMCDDCFPGYHPDHVTTESVLDMIREANTCTDLSSPVEVWIDEMGYHYVEVYDRD